jgi:hypothetical protein
MADVRDILDRFNVPYVERGANVKKGNINVRCPFCSDDPSHHMGIVPESGWYACWRDKAHRGKNFPRVLAALARISIDHARSVAAEYFGDWAQDDAFSKAVKAMSDVATVEAPVRKKTGPTKSLVSELRYLTIISGADPMCRRHRKYLQARGFDDPYALARRYSLMYAVGGEWRERIVIPYYFEGKLVTLVGRSLYEAHQLRYKALPDNRSLLTSKQVLYNYDRAQKRDGVLFVVEGPFDVLKFDYHARDARCGTVGLSSVSIEDEQLPLLLQLADRYKKVVVMADQAAFKQAMDMQAELGRKTVLFDWALAASFKDPGKFSARVVRDIARHYGAIE